MADIISALAHLVQHRIFQLSTVIGAVQQIPVGEQFETYCKDWLSLLPPGALPSREAYYNQAFCFEGSTNNPPDAMYRGGNSGDAFEFKKFEQLPASIQLNSSHPKDRLHANSPGVTNDCRSCEAWTDRNLFYILGVVPNASQRVKSLWVVDGELLSANPACYQNIFTSVQSNINAAAANLGAMVVPSRELARLKNIDPLHYTTMRARAMWELAAPNEVFKNLPGVSESPPGSPVSTLHALIPEQKWLSYSATSQHSLLTCNQLPGFALTEVARQN